MTCDDVAQEIDLYVLEGANRPEMLELERHVAGCPTCRLALERARQAAALIALAAPPLTPDPKVKQQLLARARGDARPVPPAERPTVRALLGRLRWPHLSAMPGGLIAPVALLLCVVGLSWGVLQQRQLDRLSENLAQAQAQLRHNEQAMEIMSAPGAGERALAPTAVAPAAWAQLYVAPSAMQAALVTRDLPVLPEDKVYQVWLIDPNGTRISGALFRPENVGTAIVIVQSPQPFSSYHGIGITIEPRGGSAGPTGSRILGGNL